MSKHHRPLSHRPLHWPLQNQSSPNSDMYLGITSQLDCTYYHIEYIKRESCPTNKSAQVQFWLGCRIFKIEGFHDQTSAAATMFSSIFCCGIFLSSGSQKCTNQRSVYQSAYSGTPLPKRPLEALRTNRRTLVCGGIFLSSVSQKCTNQRSVYQSVFGVPIRVP